MKRVLHVVGKMNIGGTEQFLMNIYRNIDRNKVQFDFLTFYDKGEQGYFDQEISALGGKIINIRKPRKMCFRRNIKEVEKVLLKGQYDIVHTHIGNNCAYALKAAEKSKVSIRIAHAHSTPNPKKNIIVDLYEKILKYIANKSLTKCCACSNKAGNCRFTLENISQRYLYVPNAVDFAAYLKEYDRSDIRRKLGIASNELMILQVGNFKQPKNQMFTIEVLNCMGTQSEKCKFVFAGRNSSYGDLVKNRIRQYKLEENTLLLGQRSDIPELMAAADVLIMPSMWEGLGIVLLEAQASGLPCVVSEAIQPEADMGLGLLKICSLSNVDEWKECILESKKNQRLSQVERINMVKESSFALENAIKCFMELYEI